MHWIGDGSAEYIVNAYEVNDSTRTLLITSKTTNNYIKFDPLLYRIPNLEFQILSLNSNGQILQEGDFVINEICSDCEPATAICQVDCHGRTNAWRLTAYDKGATFGHHKYLQLSDTYQHMNEVLGVRVPYWQAFTTTAYNALSDQHPYKERVNSSQQTLKYRTEEIAPNQTSIYRDRDNFIVNEGFIVEKKLDQYANRNGQKSTSFHDPLCGPTINANSWADFFDSNLDPSFGGAAPIVSNWQYYFPSNEELVCQPSGPTTGPSVPVFNLAQYAKKLKKFTECAEASLLPFPFPCDKILMGFNAFTISPIGDTSDYSVSFEVSDRGDDSTVFKIKGGANNENFEIKKGLYYLTAFTDDGLVIPTVIDFISSKPITPYSHYSKLKINSNPIIDQILNFDLIDSEGELKSIRLYDIYGNLLYSENSSDKDISRMVDIRASSSVLFVLSVVYPDGSVIQETISK